MKQEVQVMEQNWIRLPLKGAHNVRELGGIPARDGRQTGWHRFLRADQLSQLTENDREMLLAYGVTSIIDLRSESETAAGPDSPQLLRCVEYYHIPFMEADLSPQGQARIKEELRSLSGLYVSLLKREHIVRRLFMHIEQAPPGCVLFHCTAGKDRTGVLSLLLLMLAGVDKQDCQANYMQSFTNLTRDDRFNRMSKSGYHHLVRSDAQDIEPAYDYIASFPQGIYGYLAGCGLTESCIKNVQARCLDGV